jgi:hypothetical protein
MATRKPTPDILSDLLGEPSSSQHTGTPVHQPTRTAADPSPRAPAILAGERLKATFYLDPDVLEQLEEAWHQLRKLAKSPDRGKVSKSLIVEVALALALQELKAQGEASPLARIMVHQQNGKPVKP